MREYVTNVGNQLYLTSLSGDNSFFRLIGHDDNTFSLLHSQGLYVTVGEKNPYDLTLEPPYPLDELHHQKFNFEMVNEKLYITTYVTNESDIGPVVEQRYWGYTKYGPDARKLRAIGTVENNEFLFSISNYNVYYSPLGLTKDHTWVEYYNTLNNTENNYNTEIFDAASAVKISHLFDLPYNTKIDVAEMRMDTNFANMKNIQNANYEYNFKKE